MREFPVSLKIVLMVSSCCGMPLRLPFLFCRSSRVVGFAGVDKEAPADGLPAKQHAESHFIPAGEGQLDWPDRSEQLNGGHNDRSQARLSTGAAHRAVLQHLRFHFGRFAAFALNRMDLEADPFFSGALEGLDVKCMQGGGPCPGIHLYLDPGNFEFRQGNPFAPANDRHAGSPGLPGNRGDGLFLAHFYVS